MNFLHKVNKMHILHEYSVMKYTQIMGIKTTSHYINYLHSRPYEHANIEMPQTNSLDSDSFGTLTESLEKSASMKYKLRNNQMKGNKVIKIKIPRKDDSDSFGTLSEKNPLWYPDIDEPLKEDNDQSDDSVLVKNISKRHRCPKKYLEEMKQLVKEKKIKEALSLFVDMRRNFVTPLLPHYTFMIGVCGRIGYTEMAFKLFRQITDRSYKVTSATLTALFNSCAESPFPEYGLKKARPLKEKIEMKGWQITQPTYHAMIKAFGRCGDLEMAFQIVDEMAKAEIKISAATFNFLLMSCIANKDAGFTYAIEVWRKMKSKKCQPSIFTYNLLLRAARDCDIGPEEISCLLLQHWSSYTKRPYGFFTKEQLAKSPPLKLKSIESNTTESAEKSEGLQFGIKYEQKVNTEQSAKVDQSGQKTIEILHANEIIKSPQSSVSNLLVARPRHGPEILELINIKTPSDRLALIGGMEGFLELMCREKVKPNIKTFTLLLECIPASTQAEGKLLSLIDAYHVKPDVDFFNMLIKKRNFRKDAEAARNVLVFINKYELTPDIVTFGVLALGCRVLHQGSFLMNEMKKLGSCPNIEIVGAMLKNACLSLQFPYIKFVLNLMEEENIKPNEKVLFEIENVLSGARKNIILIEQGKEVNEFYQQKNLPVEYRTFCKFYNEWLNRMKVDVQEHPWLQYKTDIIDKAKPEL